MNVLSLFDGMSCGRIALERAGVQVDSYYASEIDKYAQIVSAKNYPDIIRLGDVTKWEGWTLPKIDMIIAGSPCQGFSNAGKGLNFDDPRSKLFFTFVDILKALQPKYFLLENVMMKKEWMQVITDTLGIEPIMINSALVSAQNRKRLYWTNIPNVGYPAGKDIILADIINLDDSFFEIKINNPLSVKRGKNYAQYDQNNTGHHSQDQRFYYMDGKSGTITKSRSSIPKVEINNNVYRVNPETLEKLQTVPAGYTDCVTKQHRCEMLGNGWTVDVIAHIFSYL